MYDQDSYQEDNYPNSYLHATVTANVAPSVTERIPPRKSVKCRLGVRVQGNQHANDENALVGQDPNCIPSPCTVWTRSLQQSRTLSPLRTNHGLINSPLEACPGTPLRDEEWIVVDEALPTPNPIVKEWIGLSTGCPRPVKLFAENISSALDDLRSKIRTTSPGRAKPVDRIGQILSGVETVPRDEIDLRSLLSTIPPALPEADNHRAPDDLPDTLPSDLRARLSRKVSPNPDDRVDRDPQGTPLRDEPPIYDACIVNHDCNREGTPPSGTGKPSSKIHVQWVEDATPAVPKTCNNILYPQTNAPLAKRRCISLRGCNDQSPIPAIINKKLCISRSLSTKSVTSGLPLSIPKAASTVSKSLEGSSDGRVENTDAKVSSIPAKLTKKSLSSLPAWAQLGISDYLGENKGKDEAPLKKGDENDIKGKNPAAEGLSRAARKLITALKKVMRPSTSSASTGPPSKDEKIPSSASTLTRSDLHASQEMAKKAVGSSPPTAQSQDSQEGDSGPSKQNQRPVVVKDGTVTSPVIQECSTDERVKIEVVEDPKEDSISSEDGRKPIPDSVTQTNLNPTPQPDTTSKDDDDLRTPTPLDIHRADSLQEDSGFGSMLQESSSLSPDSTSPPVQEATQMLTDDKSETPKHPVIDAIEDVNAVQPPSDSAPPPVSETPPVQESIQRQTLTDSDTSTALKHPIDVIKDENGNAVQSPSNSDPPPVSVITPPVQAGIRKQTLTDASRGKALKRPHEALEEDKKLEVRQPLMEKNLSMKARPSKKARKPIPFDTKASPLPTGPVTQLQMDLDRILLSIRRVFLINHLTYSDLGLEVERDTCVAAMKGTTQAYSYFNLVEKEGRQDFSCWQVRWGYVFMYLMRHAHLVFLSLKHIHLGNRLPSTQMSQHWKIPFDCGGVHVNAFLQRCATPGVLRVVAIGGGPGSDLIGLAMFLRANNFPARIRAVVFDRCGHWSKSWADLHQELPWDLAYYFEPVQYVAFDYLYPELSGLHLGFLGNADLITIIKSMSPVATKLWQVKPMRLPSLGLVKAHSLFNILSSVAPGAIVLYLDNKNGQQNRVVQEAVQSIPGYTMVHYETTTEKLPGRGGFSPLCQKFMEWVGYGPSFCSGNNEIVALSRQWRFEYEY